jgi:hypothetical protein
LLEVLARHRGQIVPSMRAEQFTILILDREVN